MKITNFGTSHGDPTLEHFCSSTLLETQGRYYLIDAGEPANALLVRNGLCASRVSAVFITHMHIDHTGSLPVICEQAKKYRGRFPDVSLTVNFPEAAAIPLMNNWLQANHARFSQAEIAMRAYDEQNGYDDGVIRVTATRTRHINIPNEPSAASYALKVEAEGRKVLFTGDLSHTFEDFPLDAALGCDLVFSEITHYPLEKAIPTLEKLRCGKLKFYHIHNPWQTEEGRQKALDMTAHLPYPVEFAYDGCVTVL